MKIHFLGTGPTGLVKGKGKNRRTNTSAILEFGDTTILISLSKFLNEQINKADIKPEDLDAVLLSHGHNDMTDGTHQFQKWLKDNDYNFKENPIPIYTEEKTWNRLKEDFKNTNHLTFKEVKPDENFEIGDVEIVPFRVKHARNPDEYPTMGFRFGDKLTWNEDTTGIPDKSEKYFDDVDSVIIDAAMWFDEQIFNHFNVKETLDFMADKNVKRIYLIQAGRTYPQYDEAMKKIQEYWKKKNGKAEVILTYDDMVVNRLSQKNMFQQNSAVYDEDADKIYKGDKDLILKDIRDRDKVGQKLFLVDDDMAYGTVVLKDPEKVDIDDFKELQDKHKMTMENKKQRWPMKEILFSYDFDFTELDIPKPIELSDDHGDWPDKIQFSETILNIKDIDDYDPSEQTDTQLSDDWRLLIAQYANIQDGQDVEWSEDQIIDTAQDLAKEIVKRKKEGKIKYLISEDKSSVYEEFWRKVKDGLTDEEIKWLTETEAESNQISMSETPDFFESIPKQARVLRDAVSLVGSSIEDDDYNDIDFCIRLQDNGDFISRAVGTRLVKALPENITKQAHVFYEPSGPHDNYIPIYDLVLIKREPQIVEMSEGFTPLQIFKPAKTTQDTYFKKEKLLKELW